MRNVTRCGRGPAPTGRGVGRLSVLAVSTLLLGACGQDSGDVGRGDGGHRGDAQHAAPTAEDLFRIGSLDGGSWESFSRIVAVEFDERGNLYVLDGADRRLAVVGPDGRFLRSIGSRGDGPGEFRMPAALAVLPDGRALVADAGHRGLMLFDAEGTFGRSIQFEQGVGAPSLLFADGNDAVIYAAQAMMTPGGFGQAGPADLPIYRLPIDAAAEPDLLHRAWLPPREPPNVSRGAGGGTMVRRTLRAFDPQLRIAVLPDGRVAVADTTTYRIRIVDRETGVASTIERPVPPVQVTDRERDQERTRRLQELEQGRTGQPTVMGMGGAQPTASQTRAIVESQLETMVFWPEIQVIQQMAADRNGRLWVQRFGGVGEPKPIEILDADGALLATIPPGAMEMPAAFGPGGLAAWIEHDEFDVPYVRVARLMDTP